ncbi:DUF58 domain-containing protein [Georgenia wangjunii]|uniref:DUF58 domain-containing protein n=1 Tax=Georgenia wangjunii TaxID=3117730 RepID=UPI002F263409
MNARLPTLTTRGQTFLALGVTTTVMGMVLGFPDITRVGVLLVLLPLLAVLATWRRPPRIAVERVVVPGLVAAGQPARVHLALTNDAGRRSLLYLAREEIDPRLGADARFLLPRMDPGEVHRLTYDVSSAARGPHHLGPLVLRQQDPFGLTRTGTVLPAETDVVVLPRIEELGASRPRGHGAGNDGRIRHMVALHGEDDASIRAYRDGDDLRRVHWPTTAHRGELMVRQEDRPARRRAVLVLDPREDAHAGDGETGSFEWAVSALASVAVHLTDLGHAVHLVTADAVREGEAHHAQGLEAVLRALAVAEPAQGAFDEVLRLAHSLTGAGGIVVAVAVDDDGDALRRLAGIRPPGGAAYLLLLEAATFAPQAPRRRTGAPGGAGRGTAPALVGVVGTAGWRAEVVRAGTGVRAAWDRLTEADVVAAVR